MYMPDGLVLHDVYRLKVNFGVHWLLARCYCICVPVTLYDNFWNLVLNVIAKIIFIWTMQEKGVRDLSSTHSAYIQTLDLYFI